MAGSRGTGAGSIDTASTEDGGGGGGGGGSSTVTVPLAGTFMPGPGLMAFAGPGLNALPTDALVARSANAVGLWNGSGVIASGPPQRIKFTTEGGKPAVGSPVYLAGADADAATGAGKLTAQPPTAGLPFPQPPDVAFPESPVFVGHVIDNSLYDAQKQCLVLLKLPATPAPVSPEGSRISQPDTSYLGHKIGPLGHTVNLSVNGNSANLSFGDGETLAILFTVEDTTKFTGSNWLWTNSDAGAANGWLIGAAGAAHMEVRQVNAATTTALDLGVPRFGLNCLVATIRGGAIVGSLNGVTFGSLALAAAVAAPAAGWKHILGGIQVGGQTDWTCGSVLAIAKLARSADDDELISWAGAVMPETPGNRFVLAGPLNPNVAPRANDPALAWYWRALDWNGTPPPNDANAGPAGAGFTWTENGAVALVDWGETWYRSMAPRTIDSEPLFYDSRRYPHGDPGARVQFAVPSTQQDICLAVMNDDPDNVDNGFFSVFVDGVFVSSVPPHADGQVYYYWVGMPGTTAAPHAKVEIVLADKLQRYPTAGLLKNGSCLIELVANHDAVFANNVTARRLIVVGDDDVIGHDQGLSATSNPMQASVSTQVRTDYPGIVTVHAATDRALTIMRNLYGGSLIPFAQEVAEAAALGGMPARVDVLIELMFQDYVHALCTAAQFQTFAGDFADSLHALLPAAHLFWTHSIAAHFDAIANGGGQTLAQFDAALTAAGIGRPWLKLLNTRVPNAIVFGSSNFHPTQPAGAGSWKANIKIAMPYP